MQTGKGYAEIAKELAAEIAGFGLEGEFDYGYTYEIFQYVGS